MAFDAAGAESIEERVAPLRVRPFRARELFLNAFVTPQGDDEPLQDVAHPADAERLPPFDASDRLRVAGQDGQPQIGAERFRYRSDDRPSRARRIDECDVRRAGHRAGVIVFDHKKLRPLPQNRAQLPSSLLGDGGARRVLGSWRDDEGRGRSGSLNCRGQQTLLVESDRHRNHRKGVQEIGDTRETGIFDKNAIAGTKLFPQHALDAVKRAADDGDTVSRHAIGCELPSRQRHEVRVIEIIPVEPRPAIELAEKGRQIGQ